MIGQHQVRIQFFCQIRQCSGLHLIQGGSAHIIPGAGRGITLGEFDFSGLEPSGRIVEVQIHAQKIGLPPFREGNGRIFLSQFPGKQILGALRSHSACHQIHPVGIHQGYDVDHHRIGHFLCPLAEENTVLLNGLRQILGVFQQYQRRDPFIGMVRRRKQHMPISRSDGEHPDGALKICDSHFFQFCKGVFFRDLLQIPLIQLRCNGHPRIHNGHKNHLPAVYAREVKLCYLFCSSQISSTAISAGLTPETRPACPMDMGRISLSFSLASSRRPAMAL